MLTEGFVISPDGNREPESNQQYIIQVVFYEWIFMEMRRHDLKYTLIAL